MWVNIMSARLCGAACADADVAAEVEVDAGVDVVVASFVPELPHAPIRATAASAATPVTTVFGLFTTHPFRWFRT